MSETNSSESVKIVLERAYNISSIRWIPLNSVPNNKGHYPAGEVVIGMPYSSVKELDKFVGIDVSFSTFMAAVHNPRSVLYSENVSQSPYHGSNGAAFYGVVCSSVVNYAFGLKINFPTDILIKSSKFKKAEIQSPEFIQLCDVLWSKGHEVMIYSIDKDRFGNVEEVSILESSNVNTRIRHYSFKEFCQRWEKDQWVIYRFAELDSIKRDGYFDNDNSDLNNPLLFNNIIALYRGNHSVFREDEKVMINILNSSYNSLLLYRNGVQIEERDCLSDDVVFEDLPYGYYSVIAKDNKGHYSKKEEFEVIDANVSVTSTQSRIFDINFKSGMAEPVYVALCSLNGTKYLVKELSRTDLANGFVTIVLPENITHCFCKVYFSTSNGIVTNNPIEITD